MSWCTTDDLTYHSGSVLDSTTLQAIIDGAEREIVAHLTPLRLSGDSTLREASLHLSLARLYTRYHISGQMTSEPSISAADHEKQAWGLVEQYISKEGRARLVKKWVSVG